MNKYENRLPAACTDYEEDLVLYYYGDCSEAEGRRVETHLKECRLCWRFLEDLKRFLPHMARTKEFPQSFWDGYYTEMLEKLDEAEERRSWWRRIFSSWPVPAWGTAVAVMLALGLLLTKAIPPLQGPEKVPAEILGDAARVEFFKTMDLLESLELLEAMEASKIERDSVRKL